MIFDICELLKTLSFNILVSYRQSFSEQAAESMLVKDFQTAQEFVSIARLFESEIMLRDFPPKEVLHERL